MAGMYNPPHPGRIIAEALDYLHVSASEFARNLGVAPSSITRILKEERPITPDMAVRISAALPGPSPEVWLAMQADYDTRQAERNIDTSHITRYPSVSESAQSQLQSQLQLQLQLD